MMFFWTDDRSSLKWFRHHHCWDGDIEGKSGSFYLKSETTQQWPCDDLGNDLDRIMPIIGPPKRKKSTENNL
jgi:hypothetical protein